jgi:branched-chain amino acid transport system ATP-binding protein
MTTEKIVGLGLVYIPEEGMLFPDMTTLENLKMGAYLPSAWEKRNQTLKEVFQIFPRLKERKKQLVSTLSGGERRMLAIARGFMTGSKFFAIDEPSLGLAPSLRLEVFKKIKEINKEGMEIILVEENIKESLNLCHRAYILQDGEILYEGNKEELLLNEEFKKLFFLN